MSFNPWIGVDLDGTLAEYFGWKGEEHIGKPIPRMLERVKQWIVEGKDVRIMTARGDKSRPGWSRQIQLIQDWCEEHGLPRLPVTNQKDWQMVELWDDRAVQVVPNTGERADGKP